MEILLAACLTLILLALGAALVALSVVVFRSWWSVRVQAIRDYEAARGTQHGRLLRTACQNLDKRIQSLDGIVQQCDKDLQTIASQMDSELASLLRDHLVGERLSDVPGIGPVLAREITHTVYRGDLKDLHLAQGRVRNVGSSRQGAISSWVNQLEADMPRSMKSDFPGKAEVVEKYAAETRRLQVSRKTAARDYEDLLELRAKAKLELYFYSKVSVREFHRQLRGKEGVDLTRYHLGAFPPWADPPAWFSRLVEEFI